MNALAENVLTTSSVEWATVLPDAVRLLRWSPNGRLLAVAADGSTLVGHPGQVTTPMTPDARDAVWLTEASLVVIDPIVGRITVGVVERPAPLPFLGATRVGTNGDRTVIAGDDHVAVFDLEDFGDVGRVIPTGTGVTHACVHAQDALWAVGGTHGFALIDVSVGRVEERLDIAGVVAVSCRSDVGRLVVSDLAGSIHLVELVDPTAAVEIATDRAPVRHLALSPDGNTISCADGHELMMWEIGSDGSVGEPLRVGGHVNTITSIDQAGNGFLATGDGGGVVHVWSPLLTGYPVATMRLDSEVTALAWTRDGRRLAGGSVSGEMVVVEIAAGLVA